MKIVESINFCNINFHNVGFERIIKHNKQKKLLICAPAAPALVSIKYDNEYKNALIHADYNIFDSGLFTLLLRICRINVTKYSGLVFFKDIVKYFKKNKVDNYILINPSKDEDCANYLFMKKHACSSKFKSYIAPFYKKNNVKDYDLLNFISSIKPNFIIINLGGGTQEKLGAWLKKKLNFKVTIICTGAAISFHTGKQASIPMFIDKLYLGWLIRCLYKPSIYIPRYLRAFVFIKIFFTNKNNIKIQYIP